MKDYSNKLFPYAYNILGSAEDAKDVIQDILTKYLTVDRSRIANETGFLIKSVINQSINARKRKRTVSADGISLPEPISTAYADSNIRKEEILSYSILILLDKLSAKERAVFILKEAFDYSHKEIADSIDISIEGSRKLLSRAKTKMGSVKDEENIATQPHEIQLDHYIQFIKNGDTSALEELLSNEILLAADGGENVNVVQRLTTGIADVTELLLHVYDLYLKNLDYKITFINHQPALLFFQNNVLANCQIFEIEDGQIKRIYSVVGPEKLKSLFL